MREVTRMIFMVFELDTGRPEFDSRRVHVKRIQIAPEWYMYSAAMPCGRILLVLEADEDFEHLCA